MNFFTKFLTALLIFVCAYLGSYAQWCIPVVTGNFSHGLIRFTINGNPAIDRTSSSDELYVLTGLTTTLQRGVTYIVTFTQNYGAFCSLTSLRIWIDYNKDFDFDDAGENVVSASNLSGQQHQYTFTVPSNAVLDSTRMRVASKMTQSCGHTVPSPCNNPPDPIGWHGEFEDYNVLIVNTTGVISVGSETPNRFELLQNYPNPFNPATQVRFGISELRFVNLKIYNVLGGEVVTLVNQQLSPGKYEVELDASNYPSGVYYYRLEAGDYAETKKMVLVK